MSVPGVTTRVTSRLDEPLGLGRVLDLVADGDAVAGVQQLAEMVSSGWWGKPGHRDGLVPAGQRQAQHAGGHLGVVVEELVEVAHAEEQQHARVPVLGLPVLLHHRRRHEWVRG